MPIRVFLSLLVLTVFFGYPVYAGVSVLLGTESIPLMEHYSGSTILIFGAISTVCLVILYAIVILALKSKGSWDADDDDEPWGTIVHDFTGHGSPMMPYIPDVAITVQPRSVQARSPR